MAAESKWWTQNLKLFRLICTENEVYTVAFKAGMVPIDSVEDSDQKEGRLPAAFNWFSMEFSDGQPAKGNKIF